ncbi:unnamed protein product [Danaus chrysippus]|uniref:(African queen) hypothetical protein n=1 Tax=Danaus chrysippus TaxID=151541 RepID=A0A8J2W2W6_9NEOP|nr:unnamed protein product [Danaus chrysippus]
MCDRGLVTHSPRPALSEISPQQRSRTSMSRWFLVPRVVQHGYFFTSSMIFSLYSRTLIPCPRPGTRLLQASGSLYCANVSDGEVAAPCAAARRLHRLSRSVVGES